MNFHSDIASSHTDTGNFHPAIALFLSDKGYFRLDIGDSRPDMVASNSATAISRRDFMDFRDVQIDSEAYTNILWRSDIRMQA